MNFITFFFIDAILMLFIVGFYCLVVSRNLIRVLIAVEVLTKAVTLMLILAGSLTNQTALAQAFVITLIIIEVVVIAIAAGVVIGVYEHNGTLDTQRLRNLKG
ncbi:MAG: NADH-quinone oxidoreductase subunit K [Bacillota bacterium]|nr:NADH-quinone oxidoreductase subunit K [Bacillota bacterium]